MKIAVTGATGFIGQHLVNKLLENKHQVTVLTHTPSSIKLFPDNVRIVTGSVENPQSLYDTFKESEIVYHLVGIIVETKTKTFETTVVKGTKNVIESCQEAGISRIIYLSALGTSETAQTEYHRTKYIAEQLIKSSGISYIIYRPSVIYGPSDGFVSMLQKIIKLSPVSPVMGSGKYLLQPIFIDDLVEALYKGLTISKAMGKIIVLAGPEKLEYLTILNIIKKVIGKRRMNFYIPMTVMKSVAFILEKMFKPAPITCDQLRMLEMGNTGDITEMENLFSIKPVAFEEGLKKYLR
ncbi:MAG: NAD-dependent epimerase/dehydratase family protein [Candidatus Zixiibacteriota bacterium]